MIKMLCCIGTVGALSVTGFLTGLAGDAEVMLGEQGC